MHVIIKVKIHKRSNTNTTILDYHQIAPFNSYNNLLLVKLHTVDVKRKKDTMNEFYCVFMLI